MQCCATCGLVSAVRLYDLRERGSLRRTWWCTDCATLERWLGSDLTLAPAWIERAALHQLPVKELPRRVERRQILTAEGFVRTDRRRSPRRTSPLATQG